MRSGPNKVCPSCGAGYDPGVLFCPIDGTPIASSRGVSDPGAEHDPYLGLDLPGQIQLLSLIGIGSMGRVYRAFQAGVDREVAVKILHRELGANAELVNRFHREARIASRLVHPNVVQVLMTGSLARAGEASRGEIYLVMEYLDGISLLSALAAAGGSEDEALTLPRALHIALQICDAVGEAHAQGIVHRDLKPENIMLVRRGEDEDFVKVLDFGIARLDWAEPSATQAGLIFGTAKYISPEGAQGKPVGPAADVYAIATILYQCLAGQTPFEGDATMPLLLQQINAEPPELRRIPRASYVPPAIAELVMRNLEKDPAARAEDARVLRKDLLLAARQSGITLESLMGQPALRIESQQRTKAQELSSAVAHALHNIERGASDDRTEAGMDPPEARRGARTSSPSRDAHDPSAPPQRTVIAEPLHDDDGGTISGDPSPRSRRPGGTLSGDDGPGAQSQLPFQRNRRFEDAGFFGPSAAERQRASGSDLAAMSSSEPGRIPKRGLSRPILAALGVVALVAIGFVAMKAARPTSVANADPIEERVIASERALEQRAWDAPPGKNVKELTDAWLREAPQDARALSLRRRAAERVVIDALDRKYAGDVGGALHLARLAIDFDPTVIAGRQLVQELEGAPSIEPANPPPLEPAEPKMRPRPTGTGPLPKTSAALAPSAAAPPTSSAAVPPASARVPAPLPPQPPPLGEDPRSVGPASSRPWL